MGSTCECGRRHRSLGRGALGVSVVALVVAMSGSAIAVTGGTFILGRANTANATSTLSNTAGTPLSLKAKSGRAPLAVNSTVRVPKLNADLLDGLHSGAFLRSKATAANASKLGGQTVGQVKSGLKITPKQLATLRWDKDPTKPGTFATGAGTGPAGIGFDGAHMWVTNYSTGTVSVFNLNGTKVGTYATGLFPFGIAFDGTHMWVTNTGSDNVSVFNLNGTQINGSPFTTGETPIAVAFDGSHMWVTNGVGSSLSVFNLDGSRAAGIGASGTVNSSEFVTGVAFDGTHMWVVSLTGDVSVFNLNGTQIAGSPFATGKQNYDVAFDGTRMWVSNPSSNTVTVFNRDGTLAGTYATGLGPEALAFDGSHMWVGNSEASNASVFNLDGTKVTGSPFATGAQVKGAAFDGANMWFTNIGADTVRKLRIP